MITAHSITSIPTLPIQRIPTNLPEFDTLMGGGLVPGSTILFAGQPGVGKSTFLLQITNIVAQHNKVLYVSGEESLTQMKMRAERIGTLHNNIFCTELIVLEDIVALLETLKPSMIIVDSIQMIYSRESRAAQSSPSQIKRSLLKLIEVTKKLNIIMIAIGHSTKSGKIAGLLALQHMVDITMFMTLTDDAVRILNIEKSRFGPSQTNMQIQMNENGFSSLNQGVKIIKGNYVDTTITIPVNDDEYDIYKHLEINPDKQKIDFIFMIAYCIKLAVVITYTVIKLTIDIINYLIGLFHGKQK